MNSDDAGSEGSNPYRTPETDDDRGIQLMGDWYVDGSHLVVSRGVKLPNRCVLTNRPVTDSDFGKRTLKWAPAFSVVSKRGECKLSYALAENIRKRHRVIRWYIPVVLWIVFVSFCLLRSPYAMLWFLTLVLAFQCARGLDPIRIHKMRGNVVWLTGFCREFLDQCEREMSPEWVSHQAAE